MATRTATATATRSASRSKATPSNGHFTPELFRFLRSLERHNDRAWFEQHRDQYLEHVRDPMLRFIEDVAPRLRKISRHVVADPRGQGGSMLRIHRDMRFARDKRPYKTAAAARFRHERGRELDAPGFYLHLGATRVFAGAGVWRPAGPAVAKIRTAIVAGSARWKRLRSAKAFTEKLRLDGESLRRPPRGVDPDHPLIDDLKRKDFVAVTDLDEDGVCAPDFLDRYVELCRASAPLNRFLAGALGLEW